MEKLYDNVFFMWVMLFTVTPIGIILMWRNSTFKKFKKIRATLIFSMLYIGAVLQIISNIFST